MVGGPEAGSVSWCPQPCAMRGGLGWVGSNTDDGLGAVRGPPHPETGSLSLWSRAELGRACGWDLQVWGFAAPVTADPQNLLSVAGGMERLCHPPIPPGWCLRAQLPLTRGRTQLPHQLQPQDAL